MRTSRVSRETAKVVNALSPAKRTATRRSLRAFAATPIKDDSDGPAASSGSEMSPPPSSADEEEYDSSSNSAVGLGKRKRSNTTTPFKNIKADPDTKANGKKTKRQPIKRIKGERLLPGSIDPPPNWEQTWSHIASMRKNIIAPVDTMGCETLALPNAPPATKRLQTLVALMLSSQTKDTVTAAAMQRLQTEIPGGLTLSTLLSIEPAELNRLIGQVGFHNNKTKYLKATALILESTFKGDIPSTIEGLTSLPGVGPKMAYLCMSAAWGRDEGIGVDVHVHRITNRLGWHKTSTPEGTREQLEGWLPREKWHEINTLLVGLGQMVCLPVGPRCGECELQGTGLCPSAVKGKASPRKKKVKVEVKEEVGEAGEIEREVEVKVEPADEQPPAVIADIEGPGEGALRRSLSIDNKEDM